MSPSPSKKTLVDTSSAEQERPAGIAVGEESPLESLGGVSIHWHAHLPSEAPRAVLLFVHGLGEHSGRYHWPIGHFAPRGFACYAFDLRGHGRSGGKAVHVTHFDDYDADVEVVLRVIRDRHPGVPIFLVGHSMGGAIVLRYGLRHADGLDGLILSSPGLDAHPDTAPPGWLKLVGALVSRVAPEVLFPSGLDPNLICRDESVVRAYIEDPAVSNKVSARWFTSFVAAQEELFEKASNLRLPLLLMQSEEDRLVDPAATKRWADVAPPDLVSYYTWPGFYHEMFNEPDRERVYQLMERWLDDRISAAIR